MDSTELTQFGLKQLFYQVKQSFPEVPDAVVNMCIRKVTFKPPISNLQGLPEKKATEATTGWTDWQVQKVNKVRPDQPDQLDLKVKKGKKGTLDYQVEGAREIKKAMN